MSVYLLVIQVRGLKEEGEAGGQEKRGDIEIKRKQDLDSNLATPLPFCCPASQPSSQ